MYDIHTHLYWESYDTDRDEVIKRAREAGVEKMFVIGCTIEESKQCVELAEKYSEIFASVGLHPHFFNELVEEEFSISNFQFSNKSQFFNEEIKKLVEELRELAKNKNVVAIGECGLDYFGFQSIVVSEEQKALQKEGFLAQMQLAEELHLPLIIHCRSSVGSEDANEDMFDILKNRASLITHQLSCILHSYKGDTEMTKKFLTLPNVYFSFTANITYPVKKVLVGTKDDAVEMVKMIPLPRIFAETDCPFLAPQEKRGERNEPAYVLSVVAKIAEIQGLPIDEVKRSIEARTKEIFGA